MARGARFRKDSRPAAPSWAAEVWPGPARQRAVEEAIQRAQHWLLARQHADGYWVGELEADASVAAGYVPLMYYMLGAVDARRQRKVVNQLRRKQNPDGSWSSFHGGPGDLNVSIQCYLALKLAALPAGDPDLQRARAFILSRGGIGKASLLTRVWLAVFGQFDWRLTPSVPPEMILLPNWSPLSIYDFASWSRATIMALAIVLTLKPVCPLPAGAGVAELYLEPEGQRHYPLGRVERLFSWKTFFLGLDRLLKLWERLPWQPGRRLALRRTARWVEEHQEADGSWGGIMLPWVYSLIGLKALGYPLNHPVVARGLAGLEGFIVEDAFTLRLQPATSPVWDTAWTVIALRESGLPADHPCLVQAARWLLKQEIRVPGDWQVKNPRTAPGCWAFEFENKLYPDLDDTPVVARALRSVQLPQEEETAKAEAIARGLRWTLAMQSRDGGWAAFDRDCDKQFLAHVPFADFMSPLDPTCADVTAHVVELLADVGNSATASRSSRALRRRSSTRSGCSIRQVDETQTPVSEGRQPAVRPPETDLQSADRALSRALAYLERRQERDGSWYGRWGVNYLYGTGLTLAALAAAGRGGEQPSLQRAVAWLASCQNPDGGWGESCASYEPHGLRGSGPSSASQTAWALLGLLAAGEATGLAARRGLAYLLRNQRRDGQWPEAAFTGTGFPRAFYLRYDLYRIYFPLLALARCRTDVRPKDWQQ